MEDSEVFIKENFDKVCKNWNLFCNSYWGGGCYTETYGTALQLFKNRDIIAERYNLKKLIDETNYGCSGGYEVKKIFIDAMIIDEETLNENLKKEIDFLEDNKKYKRVKIKTATGKEINKLKIECIKKQFKRFGSFNYERDHAEYYLDNDGNTISIFSLKAYPSLLDKILRNGYIQIEPIYLLDRQSFIKVIPPISRRRRY